MKKRLVIFLLVFVMVTLACTLTNLGTPTPQGEESQPGGTPPSQPVSISDGLASLNSYQITITSITRGPDPAESTTIVIETRRSQDQKARYTHVTQTVVHAGDEDPSISENELYRIGNDQCSGSGGDWSWTSMAPNQAEMQDVIMKLYSISPIFDNPTFVSQETVSGIPSNHFTFKVAGLGVESGAEVTANQGDYWLAIDGQYIVKYSLVLETVMDPQTNVLHTEISIDLSNVNQPVNVAFPQACLDASLVTPEP
jgi:hypothetical protein